MQRYNLADFLVSIANTLIEASGAEMSYDEAMKDAEYIYQDFIGDEAEYDKDLGFKLPRFGDRFYDWTEAGAKTLAEEYSINYWD